jgi:hypothetical protein
MAFDNLAETLIFFHRILALGVPEGFSTDEWNLKLKSLSWLSNSFSILLKSTQVLKKSLSRKFFFCHASESDTTQNVYVDAIRFKKWIHSVLK